MLAIVCIEKYSNYTPTMDIDSLTCYIFRARISIVGMEEFKMGKFVIKEAKTGVKFNLKAGNGEIIATSQVYKDEVSCRKGIASVAKNAPIAPIEDQTVEGFEVQKHPKFEVYKDKAGEFRFRLKATNGQIIAVGEGYKALASCKKGIESIKKNAPDAPIVVEEAKEEK